MAKRPLLEAETRSETGTRAVRALRKSGRVPAVMYGPGVPTESISLDAEALRDAVEERARIVDIKLGSKKQPVVVKEIQFDHLGSDLYHADFERIDLSEVIHVEVPVETHGTAKGTRNGGILEIPHFHVRVECKAGDVPNEIKVEVADLDIGDVITVGQLELPKGVKVTDDPGTVVVHVQAPRKPEEVEVEEVGEEIAEPEVIGGKKEDEEAEGEE